MAAADLSLAHRFEPGDESGRPPLLLLHGTGGNENDLMSLGQAVAPGAALLSPRGRVLEGDMPRFFRRLAEGRFDHEDVRRRAHELADFVEAARQLYGIGTPVALGFSNGANIAAALLYLRPEVLAGAALLRAMEPLDEGPEQALDGKPVLIISGEADPMIPAERSVRLVGDLEGAGANVSHRILPARHGLTETDITETRAWLNGLPAGPLTGGDHEA